MTDKESIQRDRSKLEAELVAAGCVAKGKTWKCNFHDDRNPSGSIYLGEDGVWRFKCFGCDFCGDIFDVQAKREGKSVDDVLRQLRPDTSPAVRHDRVYASVEEVIGSRPHVAHAFKYTDPDSGVVDLIVLRIEPPDQKKTFSPFRKSLGGWVNRGPAITPLYNRTRLRGAKRVIWVEGELKVHALTALGYTATTTAGGSKAADKADYSPLAGVDEVVIWPDYDALTNGKSSGQDYANDVTAKLEQLKPIPRISIIDPSELGISQDGSDVIDYLADCGGDSDESKRAAVEAALATATAIGAADDLYRQLDDTISGKRRALGWPWRCVAHYSKALMPGTITVLCGAPGASKSFFVLELAWWMHGMSVPMAILELEEDRAYHLQRVLAQMADKAELTDPDWIKGNPGATLSHANDHRDAINSFASTITVSPDKPMTYRDIVNWTKERAAAGCKFIIVDPVTAAESGSEKPWVADLRLVTELKLIARAHSIPIMIVTHPAKMKGATALGLDNLSGGTAFQRFSQCVLWLERITERPVLIRYEGQNLEFPTTINRIMHLMKVRNGPGTGKKIGFVFSKQSLRFEEQGLIEKKMPADSERKNADVEDAL